MDERIAESSGNVFRDLGRPDADLLLFKAQLAAQIGSAIARRGWSQSQAANQLGVDQPRISNLVRGRLSGFSTDALLDFLKRLDVKVSIMIEDPITAPGEPVLLSI
ncbi:MAG: XRE family transcriptional regulator [Chloroflexi bacterium]|nr:XRE family transcriptional regulator [Chloroflexota bacterium]